MILNLSEIDRTLSRFFRLKQNVREDLLKEFGELYLDFDDFKIDNNVVNSSTVEVPTFNYLENLVDFLKICLSNERFKENDNERLN